MNTNGDYILQQGRLKGIKLAHLSLPELSKLLRGERSQLSSADRVHLRKYVNELRRAVSAERPKRREDDTQRLLSEDECNERDLGFMDEIAALEELYTKARR